MIPFVSYDMPQIKSIPSTHFILLHVKIASSDSSAGFVMDIPAVLVDKM